MGQHNNNGVVTVDSLHNQPMAVTDNQLMVAVTDNKLMVAVTDNQLMAVVTDNSKPMEVTDNSKPMAVMDSKHMVLIDEIWMDFSMKRWEIFSSVMFKQS